MRDKPQLSVVIPAHNESKSVGSVVHEIREILGREAEIETLEILVVDDGSSDETSEVAREAGATVLRNERRRGYGACLKRGIRASDGRFVCCLDGDGTYPVQEIPAMVELMRDGVDQVIGARVGRDAAIPLTRRPAKWLVNQFASQLTRCDIPDLNSGLRCFDRQRALQYLRMFPDGFSFSSSMTVAALLDGWEVRFQPIGYNRRTGKSKFRAVSDTARLLLAVIRAVVYTDPLKLFLPIAVALGLAALGFGVYDVIWENNLTDKTVLFTIGSLELFVLGLLADMIVKKL